MNNSMSDRSSKKRKTLKRRGGAVKINFAYTYYDIPPTALTAELNRFIKIKSKRCDCISLRNTRDGCNETVDDSPIITGTDHLILIFKYDVVDSISKNPALLSDTTVLSQMLGHGIISLKTHPTHGHIVSIYDICVHDDTKTGYGSVLFNLILTFIRVNIPGNYILWLGVRIDNTGFEKVVHIYTSFGFAQPFITNTDPFGNILPFYFVSLSKNSLEYVANEYTTVTAYNKCIELKAQLDKMLVNESYVPTMSFKLDKSAILQLRLFPYLGLEGINPTSHAALQREYSGSLSNYSSELLDNKTVIYTLSNELNEDNTGIKYVTGSDTTVDNMKDSSYGFHTHPISLYIKNNVLIGTPSAIDIMFVFRSTVNNLMRFHMVVTVEGLYICSLSKDFILAMSTDAGKEYINRALSNQDTWLQYEFPYSDRPFSWESNNTLDENAVSNKVSEYLEFIRKIPNNPIDIQFFPWKNITKDLIIKINYPTYFLNSFADIQNSKILKNIYGPQVNQMDKYSRNLTNVKKLYKTNAPSVLAVPAVPSVTNAPSAPVVPNVPVVPKTPSRRSRAAAVPNAPAVPNVPAVPNAPVVPKTPARRSRAPAAAPVAPAPAPAPVAPVAPASRPRSTRRKVRNND